MNTIKRYFKTLLLLFSLTGCGKEFLDIKRNSNQVVPKNISDYQALLDYNPVMNNAGSFELVCLGTDEYTLPGKTWETASPVYYTHVKNGYIWADDVYEGKEVNDWNWAYQRIMYANLALDVDKLEVSPDQENNRNNVRGQAMFHRAFTFYQLVQAFCKPFNPGSAETDPGIPLRLDYDVSVTVDRGTLKEVYAQILQDLTTAVDLLPDFQENNYRPSRLATYALLARVYREMDRWDEALASVQYVLERKLDLLNFNDFDDAGLYSFENMNRGLLNPEILFYCHTSAGYIQSNGVVTEEFINKYKDHDLRKYLFFKDDKKFYGSYAGFNYFTGLAVDEVLLIRAECLARKGNFKAAAEDLGRLLSHRYETDKVPAIAEDLTTLQLIKEERIKELYLRGTRWSDIRKANLTKETEIMLKRDINGAIYTLLPNDDKWVWPIPDNELRSTSVLQNPR
ncbi:RagB/SusD family nutrient uptake outer membrane protein [Sphingobacterium pedocola]|uniref:RagB/SusD family nutrient uptake outer membrane protein n=1 Tax=Sphingobacterium pedocola TaxID=2082722 RepID=A0ABR9TAK8_9SPHI|nr:RagB/SusD family nutrient uptake outer membrane protein [Sphingobacterium pedocola]MBE8722305.1 hypothetical protein [Sphingobacterium pedocola]